MPAHEWMQARGQNHNTGVDQGVYSYTTLCLSCMGILFAAPLTIILCQEYYYVYSYRSVPISVLHDY